MLKQSELKALMRVAPVLYKVIPTRLETEAEYDAAVMMLDDLIAETAGDSQHPLSPIINALGTAIQSYETQNPFIQDLPPNEMLQYLMDSQNLKQSDLKFEIGSQGVVSEVLSSKRSLNTRQIAALSQRFKVSPAVFYSVMM